MSKPNPPTFPAAVWTGTSPTRPDTTVSRSPDYEDFEQAVVELIAVQSQFRKAPIASLTNSTGGTADGTLAVVPSDTLVNVAAACNNNFTELHAKVDAILVALRSANILQV